MKLAALLEVLHAAHWTYLVKSEWEEAGGIMIVAPPASLKTTIVKTLDIYHDTLILGDINVPTLVRLRDDIAGGRYRTLVFPEFEKLYQRNPQTALNIEGNIKQFVEEGFSNASFEDARMPAVAARAMVVGAMTPACFRRHIDRWNDNGFARRFLWCHYTFDSSIIADSIDKWQRLNVDTNLVLQLNNKKVPYTLTPSESSAIRNLVKHQRGQETPFSLLKKVSCILKQKEEHSKNGYRYMTLLKEFGQCLSQHGTVLEL